MVFVSLILLKTLALLVLSRCTEKLRFNNFVSRSTDLQWVYKAREQKKVAKDYSVLLWYVNCSVSSCLDNLGTLLSMWQVYKFYKNITLCWKRGMVCTKRMERNGLFFYRAILRSAERWRPLASRLHSTIFHLLDSIKVFCIISR